MKEEAFVRWRCQHELFLAFVAREIVCIFFPNTGRSLVRKKGPAGLGYCSALFLRLGYAKSSIVPSIRRGGNPLLHPLVHVILTPRRDASCYRCRNQNDQRVA